MKNCLLVLVLTVIFPLFTAQQMKERLSPEENGPLYQPEQEFARERRIPYHYPGLWYSFLPKAPSSTRDKMKRFDDVMAPYQNLEHELLAKKNEDDYEYRKKLWEMYNIYNRYT